ncbi:MAG TPA: DegQ family serine endoprotease [Casimicrobiaceae bacterium]|jgi:serine protease Do
MFPSLKSLALASVLLASASFVAPIPALAQGRAGLPDFTDLYERQGATVVSVDVTQKAKRPRLPELSEDDPFYEFFRRFGQIPRNGPGGGREFEQQSTGSGFIISPDGYIVTNAHVVDDASEVTVRLSDKREFVAKVVGSDARTDVSLLKIDAKDLPRVAIGDPDKLRVGEWVVAIGKPFGLENTMTAGIVSAKGRDLPQENLVPFIQTDVAINPGNSGGPLFNMKGEVVGINSLIYSRTGGYMGLAFAVPIDVAMNAVNQLREKGHVTRGRIGVQIQELSKEAAEAFGLKQANGALVNGVERDGPAAKAGIETGDIILKVDSRDVRSSTELPRIITAIRPGTKITLTVFRKGTTKEVPVVVAEIKEDQANATQRRSSKGGGAPKEKAKPNKLGLVLSDLSDEQRKEIDQKSGGVLVEDVVGVVRGNVQPGDIILAIIQKGAPLDAKSAAQVNDYLAKLDKGAAVTFQMRRGEQTFYTTLKPGNGE